jgi:murein tripeptide amidase MpaA
MPPSGYLSSSGIESCLVYLASAYPSIVQLITLPETSVEGRTSRAIRIGRGDGRHGVLLIGGVHARELVNPDLLLSFAFKLCVAYTNNTGLTFGPVSYTNLTVRLLVDAMDIFIFPLVNPDGRAYVQSPSGYAMWRKNRSLNGGAACMGVDLNRNYDFLWSSGIGTSASSCSDVFKGPAAFSEPETRNVRHLLDEHPFISCMMDVHSYSELVLYPWGDDNNQTTDPAMNFLNPAFNGLRGTPGDSVYKEYIPASQQTWLVDSGVKVRDAIAAVRGRAYTVQQSILLYPTTGTAHDYAFSRQFGRRPRPRVYAYTLETGREFQPPYSEALNIIQEVSSGLVQFCLRCLCVVEEAVRGTGLVAELDDLRLLRDRVLPYSPAGQKYLRLLEEHGVEMLSIARRDEALGKETLSVLERISAVVRSREAAKPKTFSADLLAQVDELAQRYARKAGPALRAAIRSARSDLKFFQDNSVEAALKAASETSKQRKKSS